LIFIFHQHNQKLSQDQRPADTNPLFSDVTEV